MSEDCLAEGRKTHLARAALEQRSAELGFERGDSSAHYGLGCALVMGGR